MSVKIQTLPGHALPPAPYHSITVHMPSWNTIVRFADRDPDLMTSFKSMYPRLILHRDVKELVKTVVNRSGVEGQTCLLFTSPEAAASCVRFATSPARGENAASPDDISTRIFSIDVRLYAVFFPPNKTSVVHPFWTYSGTGISSRMAEKSLKHLDMFHEVLDNSVPPNVHEGSAQGLIRERIAELLERAPAGPSRKVKVSTNDVYLFQTGMAAIYGIHQYLLNRYNEPSVLFGFAFHHTIHVLEDFGPGSQHLGMGTTEELDDFEVYLESERKEGRKVQAVWMEFPSNPLIVTPDLARLRKLGDEYKFVLIVDDTIGGFCNVDLLGSADIVVTSLTKAFSGYADVMGGSAVVNPSSQRYAELTSLFKEFYRYEYCNDDAEVMERNSRNYIARSAILNQNSARLVEYLHKQALDPRSSVARVYFPTLNQSLPNYQACMRSKTDGFTPGYGCMFSVEFHNVEATKAFYDNLNVHQGPHLGAHLTLALPYVRGLYGNQLDWAAKYGLKETQIRIAPGLEDTNTLLEAFRTALYAADTAMNM